jgi:hypothetical protein
VPEKSDTPKVDVKFWVAEVTSAPGEPANALGTALPPGGRGVALAGRLMNAKVNSMRMGRSIGVLVISFPFKY